MEELRVKWETVLPVCRQGHHIKMDTILRLGVSDNGHIFALVASVMKNQKSRDCGKDVR
jgi:hypothetical protein